MNKNLLIGLAVVAVLGLGAMAFLNTPTPEETVTPTQQGGTIPTPTETEQLTNEEAPTQPQTAETVTVNLTSGGYSPETITISPGTTVVWTNNSGSAATVDSNPHPVHTSYRPLNLESFANGQTHELTFTEPGTYNYHDHLNPQKTGTIIVE